MTVDRSAPLVVRVAGLPAATLSRLRFTETAALAEALISTRQWLAAEAMTLSASLFGVIGAAAGSAVKPGLVGLRRAVGNLRTPSPREWSAATRAALPAEVRHRVDAWLATLHRWRADHARLGQVLAEEETQKREALRQITADPGFRRGLWQASESLSDELDRWLGDPGLRPGRQVLFRLAKYVARAAAKTSPYSTFTVSGLGRWQENGPALRLARDWRAGGVLELHGRIREDLALHLYRHPTLRAQVPVTVNPSLTVAGHTASFLAPPPADHLVSVPITPTLRRCLEVLDHLASGPPVPLRTVVARVAAATGAADRVAVARFIRHLAQIGLIVALPPYLDQPERLDRLAPTLAAAGHEDSAGTARALRQIAAGLRGAADLTDLDGHRAAQRSVRAAVSELHARLGVPEPPGRARVVAHDLAVATSTLATCGHRAWAGALADLSVVRRWLAPFNTTLPLRLALADVWRSWRHVGAAMPFLTFVRAVQETATTAGPRGAELATLLSGPAAPAPTLTASAFRSLRELAEIRHHFRQQARPVAGTEAVVRLEAAALLAAVDDLPGWVPPLDSLTCYVQPFDEAGTLLLAVNLLDGGHGRARGRVAYLVDRAGGPAPASAPARPDHAPVLAELSGGYGSSLNDRRPYLPYEIAYPFTATRRSSAEQLPLNDLLVEYDPRTELLRLRSRRLGAEVRALHLGIMTPALLPSAARLLVTAFGDTSMLRPDQLLSGTAPMVAPGQVHPIPRVCLGQVVLRRRRWIADLAAVPVRAPGESDPDYLLRLTAWRRDHGIPSRFFLRTLPAGADGAVQTDLRASKERKPLYLDLANWFLVLAFENILRSSPRALLIEEALPDPDRVLEPTGSPRVSELVIELNEPDPGALSAVAVGTEVAHA